MKAINGHNPITHLQDEMKELERERDAAVQVVKALMQVTLPPGARMNGQQIVHHIVSLLKRGNVATERLKHVHLLVHAHFTLDGEGTPGAAQRFMDAYEAPWPPEEETTNRA